MVSKYYKITQKSLGNNSFKSFQLYLYMYSLFLYLLTYLIDKLRRLILPQRREVVVSGNGNYFYQADAHRKDKISDELDPNEIPSSSDSLF